MITGYQGQFDPAISVSIASGQTTSVSIATEGFSLCAIQMPAAFTGSSISFLVSTTLTGTYQPLHNSSGLVSYSVAQGQFQAISPVDFQGVAFFQIVSNSSEGAARALSLSMKGI